MATHPNIAAIILAAGRSTRMGDVNKLLADFDGRPMIARTVAQTEASVIEQISVVIGHQADEIQHALSDQKVKFIHNRDFRTGMATSLVAGIGAMTEGFDAALIVLGDMPLVTARDIDELVAAFANPDDICLPVCAKRRGNPVLWGRDYFPALQELTGDKGAKDLLKTYGDCVVEVVTDNEGVLRDFDTAESLA